ncbi:MAG: hypothetical protein JO337_01055, partial [Acidimicrobiales bacterium]|nr:hypothetical protein [Acidimicrobiales bacterium]
MSGSDPGPWITGPPPPPPGSPRPDWAERLRGLGARVKGPELPLVSEPPFLIAGAAILVAYGLGWVNAILTAVRHQPGWSARDRALLLFGVGSVEWAAIVLLGAVLVALG